MDIKELYDAIDSYAIKILLYNISKNGTLGLYGLSNDEADLWLAAVYNTVSRLSNKRIYIGDNYWNYLWLKWIKGFRKLRYSYKKRLVFEVKADLFEEEIAKAFEKDKNTLKEIYKEYYKRGR